MESTAVPGKTDIYAIVYDALTQSRSSVISFSVTGLDDYVYNVSGVDVVGDAGSAQEDDDNIKKVRAVPVAETNLQEGASHAICFDTGSRTTGSDSQ